MNSTIFFGALALLAGCGSALLHFRGLWWAVRWLPYGSGPALLTLESFMPPMFITVTAFYLVMSGFVEVCGLSYRPHIGADGTGPHTHTHPCKDRIVKHVRKN
jgi:F1F0 ATPase subunit 2